jgi:hypothetical protein
MTGIKLGLTALKFAGSVPREVKDFLEVFDRSKFLGIEPRNMLRNAKKKSIKTCSVAEENIAFYRSSETWTQLSGVYLRFPHSCSLSNISMSEDE